MRLAGMRTVIRRLFIIAISAVLIVLVCRACIDGNSDGYYNNSDSKHYSENSELILVNKHHKIPRDYDVGELVTLSNGEKVSSKIYPSLQQMFDDARASGLHLFVASGYRTEKYQRQLLEEKEAEYMEKGLPWLVAKKKAREWVAKPGTSEHQLGLAVDINAEEGYSSQKVYDWLNDNCYKYGFIRRYPTNKKDITGVINEPWHYRYVGKAAAKEIHDRGICLEEYLD